MTPWTLLLPWPTPPLRSNDRDHWRKAGVKTRGVRTAVALTVKGRPPITDLPVVVTLVWTVTTNGRRDVGAACPTLKAALDGLVDAHVLPDDSWRYVSEERYRIERGDVASVRIEIRQVSA